MKQLLLNAWEFLVSLFKSKPKVIIDYERVCPINRHVRRRMASMMRKKYPSHDGIRAIHIPNKPTYKELQELSRLSGIPIKELTNV